jgi:hypothetical protein
MVLRFKLGADGVPADVRVRDSDLNAAITDCVLKQFEMMTLTAPDGGGIAVVTWPVAFTPETKK